MNPIKVLILGTGAIGSYYGARLAKAGAEVSLACRSDFTALQANPLIQVQSDEGDFSFAPHQVYPWGKTIAAQFDYLMVCQKALPEIDLIHLLAPLVHDQTSILLIQNGVELEPPLAQAFPQNTLIGGIAFIGVSRISPGIIHHQIAGAITLGDYPHGIGPETKLIAEYFIRAGVETRTTENIQRERWKKLVWNIGFNPMGVLTQGADTHQILSQEPTRKLVQAAMDEVIALANALGHAIEPEFAKKQIQVTEKMKPYKTSMLLDFEAGRPMEMEAIVGNAVRKAEEIGFDAPTLKALYGLLVHYQQT